MRLWLPVLLTAALLTLGAAAWAVPSMGGPTGLISLPTAEVAPANEWQVAVGYRSFEPNYMYEPLQVSLWSFHGLKSVAKDAELWMSYTRASNGEDTDIWQAGGKYQIGEGLFPRTGFLGGMKLAIGASIGHWTDAITMYTASLIDNDWMLVTDVKTIQGYIVATKQLMPSYTGEWKWERPQGTRVIGTAGLMYLRFSPDLGDRETVLRPFVGVEIAGANNLSTVFEYRFKDSDLDTDPVFSTMIRRPFGSSTFLEVGMTNASPIGLAQGDQKFFARLCYSFPAAVYY